MQTVTPEQVLSEFYYHFPGEKLANSSAAMISDLLIPYINAFSVVGSYEEWIERYIAKPLQSSFHRNYQRLMALYPNYDAKIQGGLINMLMFIIFDKVTPTCGCGDPWSIAEGIEGDDDLVQMIGPVSPTTWLDD